MTRPGYKMTEIGEIPEEWSIKRLGEIANLRGRKTTPHGSEIAVIPMEMVPQNAIYCGYKIIDKDTIKPPTYCEPGDILIPKITPSVENGKQGLVPDIPGNFGFATSEVFAISCEKVASSHFIFYLLKLDTFRAILVNSMSGSTGRQRVPKEVLINLRLPVPNILEQQKIAEILTTADRKIELIDHEIQAAEELKKGLMQTLLTRGIGHTKFKMTEIGEIPEEWIIKRLKDCTTPTQNIDPTTKFGTKSFKYIDVSGVSSEQLKIVESRLIQGTDAPSRARKEVDTDDILVATVRPSLKRVAKVSSDLNGQVCSTAFCVIKTDRAIADPDYIFHSVTSDKFIQNISGFQTGSAYPAITDNQVLSTYIAIPSLEEQNRIANILSTIGKKIGFQRYKKSKAEQLKKGLMQALLTGQVRVKIDPSRGEN